MKEILIIGFIIYHIFFIWKVIRIIKTENKVISEKERKNKLISFVCMLIIWVTFIITFKYII